MVEAGGEIRTRGLNGEGRPWQIAIERPDAWPQQAHRIVALQGLAMATSGDYRNYYERDGRRISHEIDPATREPVAHRLASVTVVHEECMFADAMATALIRARPGARAGRWRASATWPRSSSSATAMAPCATWHRRRLRPGLTMPTTLLVVLLASVVLVGASVAAMAIGVMFRRPCLRGSCGGPEVKTAGGEGISCATCPNRKNKHTAQPGLTIALTEGSHAVRPSPSVAGCTVGLHPRAPARHRPAAAADLGHATPASTGSCRS